MIVKKSNLGLVLTLLFLIVVLNFQSTPVTDDYCNAYAIKQFGFVESIKYYNSNWSPSLYYFINHSPWILPFSTLTTSTIMTLAATLLSFLVIGISLNILVSRVPSKSKTLVKCSLAILIIASLGLVQSSVYFNSTAARELNILGVIRDWLTSNLLSQKDGQVYLWAFSTPLTSPKIFLSSAVLLIVFKLSSHGFKKTRLHNFVLQFIFLLAALMFGLSTESILLITFLLTRNYLDLKIPRNKFFSIAMITSSIIGVGALYYSSGSQNRVTSLGRGGIGSYLNLFVGNLWQFMWILLTIGVLAFVLVLFLSTRLKEKIDFPDQLRENLRVLAFSAICSQLVIETIAYPAAYHWFSFIIIFSVFFFVEFLALDFSKYRFFNWEKTILVSYITIIVLLSFTILNTIATSANRHSGWAHRANTSIESGQREMLNLPALDNLHKPFAPDLDLDFPSIVPFSGLRYNFTSYCYQKLPLGF